MRLPLAILAVLSLLMALSVRRDASMSAAPAQAGVALQDARTRLLALAADQTQRGDIAASIGTLKELLDVTRQATGDTSSASLSTLDMLAAAYERVGDLSNAASSRERQVELLTASRGSEHWSVATARVRLEHIRRQMSLGTDGRKQLVTVSTLMGQALQGRGNELQGESRAPAVPLIRQALAIHRQVMGDRDTVTLSIMSQLASALGPGEEAQGLLESILAIRRQMYGDTHPDVAKSLQDLARLLTGLNQYERAELLIHQTLEMTRTTLGEEHQETLLALLHLGTFYKVTGRYGLAAEPIERLWQISRRTLGDTSQPALTALEQLGSIYYQQGDYARAEPVVRQLIDLQRSASGDVPATAQALVRLALIYRAGGARERTLALYEEALAILRRHPSERLRTASALLNIGSLHASAARLTLAQPALEEALSLATPLNGYLGLQVRIGVLSNLSAIHAIRGDFGRAEALMLQSIALLREASHGPSLETSVAVGSLAYMYMTNGDDARARPLFQESIAASRALLDLAAVGQSERQQLMMAQSLRHRLDEYATLATRSPELTVDLWAQVLAWKGATLARQRLYRIAARQPETRAALDKLQVTASQLAALALGGADGDEAGRAGITTLSSQKEQMEARLARAVRDSRSVLSLPGSSDVRAALPAGAVLIDLFEYQHSIRYLFSEPRLLAFVVAREGDIGLINLGPVAPIADAVREWRATQGRGAVADAAGIRLRRLVWGPLEAAIVGRNASQLVIAMDGVIGQIPFGALPGKSPGVYLLEEWPIATIPAAQLLPDLMRAERPVSKDMLVLGDVEYERRSRVTMPARTAASEVRGDDTRFTALDGTRGEVETITAVHGRTSKAGGLTLLTREEASEAAVRRHAPRNGILHFATHGFFAPERFKSALGRSVDASPERLMVTATHTLVGYHPGLLSGLALAGANQPVDDDDGILTADEVSTLNLSEVDLAVLSACETGLGQVAGGEGLLGLQRAFHAGGARTVIATFWKVDDAATRDVMTRFYDNLWSKGMGKLTALREAQLWMLRNRAASAAPAADSATPDVRSLTPVQPAASRTSPYYWAGFVLSGDWR